MDDAHRSDATETAEQLSLGLILRRMWYDLFLYFDVPKFPGTDFTICTTFDFAVDVTAGRRILMSFTSSFRHFPE